MHGPFACATQSVDRERERERKEEDEDLSTLTTFLSDEYYVFQNGMPNVVGVRNLFDGETDVGVGAFDAEEEEELLYHRASASSVHFFHRHHLSRGPQRGQKETL